MNFLKIIIISLLFLLFTAACNVSEGEIRNTGILADRDKVSSIRQELEDRENSLLASDGDVFWTPSGTLWHLTYECGYLSNSKTVYHGSVEEAKLEGKTKACERCGKNTSESVYEQLKNNAVMPGDVFFTKEGEKWHTNLNCTVILGVDDIYHASEEVARSLGKNSACTECDD